MSEILFVQYPACTTCKKAKAWLNSLGVQYVERDIKTDNPSLDELSAWYRRSGLPLKRFFNTSGLAYKSMNLKDKLPTMSDTEQLSLLASDGMLVKRPILVAGDIVIPGFKEELWREALTGAGAI